LPPGSISEKREEETVDRIHPDTGAGKDNLQKKAGHSARPFFVFA